MEFVATVMLILSILCLALIALAIFFHHKNRRQRTVREMPASYRQILEADVTFYQNLEYKQKQDFEKRMMRFLGNTKITGVRTEVEEADNVYIAASAIIPIFGFPNWEYVNLKEILLYPGSFSHAFEQEGEDRNILGMVGDGPYNNVMILSRHSLRDAFTNKTGMHNTAIHEFAHLVDKTDGSVDGVPEYFADKKFIIPWVKMIRESIGKILENKSDINPYGATNEAEFFAVVSEYFFERPELLKEKHPDLYQLLSQIFRQDPVKK